VLNLRATYVSEKNKIDRFRDSLFHKFWYFRVLISFTSYLVYIVDALLKKDRSFRIKFRYERSFCESRFVLIMMSDVL